MAPLSQIFSYQPMNATRLSKTFEPVGQEEALTEAVRRINEKGEIKLSTPLLGIFTKISRQKCVMVGRY